MVPREKTEEKVGISGIPSFCTPAENGDKVCFDKVHSLLKSHVVQMLYQGKDVAIILSSMTDAVLVEPVELTDEVNRAFALRMHSHFMKKHSTVIS